MTSDSPRTRTDPPAGLEQWRDRDQLRDLLARFFHGLDAGRSDHAFLRSIFVEYAAVEFPAGERCGIDDVRAGVREFTGSWKSTLHALSGHVITLSADAAHVAAVLQATYVHSEDDPGAIWHLGANVGAEAVRTEDGWRLRRLAIGVVWTEGDPPSAPPWA